MSNQNPSNPARRRRIAGERRPPTTGDPAVEPDASVAEPEATPAEPDAQAAESDSPAAEPFDGAQEPPVETPAPGKGSSEVEPEVSTSSTSDTRSIPGLVLIVLGLLAAVAVGLAAYFWTQSSEAEAAAQAQTRAPAAAERAAQAVLSYNFESLDADKDKAARFLTDDYRPDYVDTFDTLVAESAVDLRADVEAQVVASSVTRASPQSADVLLFVNQTTTSTANNGEPQTALNRVTLDMQEVDGTWLVNGITAY